MKLHILVEGPSEKKFLDIWLERIGLSKESFTVIQHCGKGKIPDDPSSKPNPKHQGLLDQLAAKLRAYGKSDTAKVLVLVDSDNDNCHELKRRLTELLNYCDPKPFVLFRIAIEETEAFYLGDKKAIKRAFPKAQLDKMAGYVQDSICGTWELFQRVIGADRDDKTKWAEQMGKYMTTEWETNQSPSFQHFCKAVLKLVGEPY